MVDLERRRLMWLIILRVTWRLFDSTLQKRGVVLSRHDVLLGIGVAYAELGGHPHTISSLAAATPTSRATAMRWADRMERAGAVVTTREGKRRTIRIAPAFRAEHEHTVEEIIDSVVPLMEELLAAG